MLSRATPHSAEPPGIYRALLVGDRLCDTLSDEVHRNNGDRHYKHHQPLGSIQTVAAEDSAAEVGHEYLNYRDYAEYRKESLVLSEVIEQVRAVGSCVERIEHRDEDEECEVCGVKEHMGFALDGVLTEDRIDRSVLRILNVKIQLGLLSEAPQPAE